MEWVKRLNWLLVAISLALAGVGVAAIAKAAGTGVLEGDSRKQLIWAGVSLAAMALVLVPHYNRFRRYAYTLLVVSIPILVYLLLYGPVIKGSKRWIRLLPGVQVQPSELVKIAYICALARYLMFRENYRTIVGLLGPFLLTLVPVGLILKQPDLGTALVFVPVLFAVLFAAGARVRHLALIAVLGVATAPGFWFMMSAEQKSRLMGWVLQSDTTRPQTDDGYHLWQSKLALGSGGLSGRPEEADSWVELGYLPEARTDFVFSVIGESWGFVGCAATLLLYWLMCWLGLEIAAGTKEPFGRLVAVGIVVLLASQMLVNVGMTIGLMPITGMTLPFVSYGGSSLLSSFICLGLLLNIGARKVVVISKEPFAFRD